MRDIKTYRQGIAYIFNTYAVIIFQPDLGTILVYIPVLLGDSFAAGIKKGTSFIQCFFYFYHIDTACNFA